MSIDYIKKVNDTPIAASEAAPSSPLKTTVDGKLNADGSNATQVGTSTIVKTLGNGSDNLWNGDRFPANGHANQAPNPNDFTLRSTDHLLNFLFRNGTGGWNYSNLDTSMKEFGHAYGAIIDSDTGCYGWKIGETSNTSAYSSAAFKAIVVVWEWDAPNWNHNGYSGRNFVGVLDITHRMTESTVSDSADKKIGTLTCICPMYCENSNGNRGYTVFVKQAAGTHKAEWYIGRNTASANMNSKIQYGRISIFPIMEYRWKKFMVQQNSSISFNSDKDEYWGNRNVPFFSYSNYSGVGSTTRPVYIKANGEIGQCDPSSATNFFVSNPSDMPSSNTIASEAKTHWSNMATPDGQMVYNNRGDEYSLLFSRHGNYGNILRWTYYKPYLEILRNYNGTWRTTDWETVCPPSVLCFEYTTDTSEMATLASALTNALTARKVGGSTTKSYKPIVFLHKSGEYYMLTYQGGGSGQGGGTHVWHFQKPPHNTQDSATCGYILSDTWSGDTHTYSWSNIASISFTADLRLKSSSDTYYASNGDATIDIANYDSFYCAIIMNGSAVFTLDTDSTATVHTLLVCRARTTDPCAVVTIQWRSMTGAWQEMIVRDYDGNRANNHEIIFDVWIRRVTTPGGSTYAIATVTPQAPRFVSMFEDKAYWGNNPEDNYENGVFGMRPYELS